MKKILKVMGCIVLSLSILIGSLREGGNLGGLVCVET